LIGATFGGDKAQKRPIHPHRLGCASHHYFQSVVFFNYCAIIKLILLIASWGVSIKE
jgi:hypothetical protein